MYVLNSIRDPKKVHINLWGTTQKSLTECKIDHNDDNMEY